MDDAPIKDNEAIYDAEIAPLMTKIIEICDAHGIPMVASFEYAPEMLCTSALTTVLHRRVFVLRQHYPQWCSSGVRADAMTDRAGRQATRAARPRPPAAPRVAPMEDETMGDGQKPGLYTRR